MQASGRLLQWNDEKGYGFIQPLEGNERVFVHIKSFVAGAPRPQAGDLITYRQGQDARGRVLALEARNLSRERPATRRPPKSRKRPARPRKQLPLRSLLAIVFFLAVAAATIGWKLPVWIIVCYWALSLWSFLLYRQDKLKAGTGNWRTPEATLHFFDLIGGWPGGLIAQQRYRHKTRKFSFQSRFWICVCGNLTLLGYLLNTPLT
ncbi:DNA-binding protein [Lysobacteraceae bacterium NML120232]|nr:DNA-binding protein [Xanthomonadaceae bacterium NML120232]